MVPQIKIATLILPSGAGNQVFHQARLRFEGRDITDVFSKRNNRSVYETVEDYRYQHLGDVVYQRYNNWLEQPIGLFLGKLKSRGDVFYKDFLNPYGDQSFCKFKLIDPVNSTKKGLYAFVVNGKIEYIGSCNNQFQKQITLVHGKIHPKKCYLESMVTNCQLNALIATAKSQAELSFYLLPLEDDEQIAQLERQLIQDYAPAWNTALQENLEHRLEFA
jgi:hypothetical protein